MSKETDIWQKQTKGNAKIWKHPEITRAIVENYKGFVFNGTTYANLEMAKSAAERSRP